MGNTAQTRSDGQYATNKLLIGFENKSLTLCYANSILQVMFHHPIFVDIIMNENCKPDGLIAQFRNLYKSMLGKKQNVAVSTLKIMNYIEKQSGAFERDMHQDCHQFYFWMMDRINEQLKQSNKNKGIPPSTPTRLQSQFFSKRVTSTQCLTCKSVSERVEQQVDLSLVLPQPNVSLNYCVEQYSAGEKLTGRNKFKCDKCEQLEEAEKKTLIKTLPNFMAIHLRRFKYDETRKGITKLLWLIPFPFKIKMKANYVAENENEEQRGQQQVMYKLVGVVAHIGSGGNYGHYISYVKINQQWYLFNDDEISEVDDFMLESLWGYKGMTKCAYMLFYTI